MFVSNIIQPYGRAVKPAVDICMMIISKVISDLGREILYFFFYVKLCGGAKYLYSV
jgi:hypothetical protein